MWPKVSPNRGCGHGTGKEFDEEDVELELEEEEKNIVVIGDLAVGKTSLLFAYQNESLEPNYTPTSV